MDEEDEIGGGGSYYRCRRSLALPMPEDEIGGGGSYEMVEEVR